VLCIRACMCKCVWKSFFCGCVFDCMKTSCLEMRNRRGWLDAAVADVDDENNDGDC